MERLGRRLISSRTGLLCYFSLGSQNGMKALEKQGRACTPWKKHMLYPAQVGFRWQQTLTTAVIPESVCPSIGQVQVLNMEQLVRVNWEDGSHSLYPYVWLRDNCQCPVCTLQSAQARSLHLSQLDINTTVDQVTLIEPTKVRIVWPDQHCSEYDSTWLKKRCFSPDARRALQTELFYNERSYWGSDLQLPTASFEKVLHDDKATLDWLMLMRKVGIVLLKGAPEKPGQVARLCQRIGYSRSTFYGPTFHVQDKLEANNVAYTSAALSLHTDYPALHHPPGILALHCIAQAHQGGDSDLVDGYHAANQLHRENPEAFHTLSSLLVDFTDTGSDYCDFAVQSKNHIIDVDPHGQVVRVNFNNSTRDSVLDVPLEQVKPFYSSLKAFCDIMYRPENILTLKMEPGDVLTFDNWRLLHGRKSYISHPGNMRHLEGVYMDWDEAMSRLRILQKAIHTES